MSSFSGYIALEPSTNYLTRESSHATGENSLINNIREVANTAIENSGHLESPQRGNPSSAPNMNDGRNTPNANPSNANINLYERIKLSNSANFFMNVDSVNSTPREANSNMNQLYANHSNNNLGDPVGLMNGPGIEIPIVSEQHTPVEAHQNLSEQPHSCDRYFLYRDEVIGEICIPNITRSSGNQKINPSDSVILRGRSLPFSRPTTPTNSSLSNSRKLADNPTKNLQNPNLNKRETESGITPSVTASPTQEVKGEDRSSQKFPQNHPTYTPVVQLKEDPSQPTVQDKALGPQKAKFFCDCW
jgi:hypothetical protein